jgi:hypothetical protein
MSTYHWTCPFCGRDTTITEYDISNETHTLTIKNSLGFRALHSTFIICPNPECKKYILNVNLYNYEKKGVAWESTSLLSQWSLIPASDAKVFPDYVPAIIRTDYAEACAIRKLSPKASATLARRC